MPTPDLGPRRTAQERLRIARERADAERLIARLKRRFGKRRGDGEGESCPVEPNRPLDLSGGAAAALEFDD